MLLEIRDCERDIGEVGKSSMGDLVVMLWEGLGLGEEDVKGDLKRGENGFELGDGELDIVWVDC